MTTALLALLHTGRRPGRQRLRALLLAGLVAAGVLGGCASVSPPPVAPLLHDALFGHPPRPAQAEQALALDTDMRAYLDQQLASGTLRRNQPRSLTDLLYKRSGLQLQYDAAYTRTAAQAFADRSGNCLSLVLMTAAFAQALGLQVSFQSARIDDVFSRSGDITLRSGHVNLVLGPAASAAGWQAMSGVDNQRLQVDFAPPDDLRGLRTRPISQATVLAMFMNNRAAEALLQQQPSQAYAWVRESLRQDPGFWPAFNTLGVVYQRTGHLAEAAAAFEQVLARDAQQLAAIVNLTQVLQAQGRSAEAAQWDTRRRQLEPVAPFQHLQLGDAALLRGALAEALAFYATELRLSGESAEVQGRLALAHARLGDLAAAQLALQRALGNSGSAEDRQRYAGKLARLRAQGQL